MQLKLMEGNQVQTIEDNQVQTIEEMRFDALESFIAELDTRGSTKTAYRKALKQLFSFMYDRQTLRPQLEDILVFKRSLVEAKLSPNTVSSYLVATRRFFEWTDAKRIYPNVAKSVKTKRASGTFEKDPMTLEQVISLLKSVDTHTLEGKRDFALLNLLIGTGLRTIEVVRANIGDIRQQSGRVVLYVHRKGRDSKDKFVVLTSNTHSPIMEYLFERKGQEEEAPLFSSLSHRNRDGRLTTRTIRRIVKERLRGIGIDSKRITAHSLRHTSATLSLLNGASLQEVQSFLGHSNINTTLIYSHNIDRLKGVPEEKLSEVLKGYANN